MEIILNTDIAKLVLSYLREQNLEKASRVFCETSHHLKEEFSALKRGYRPIGLTRGNLENIIHENCRINSKVHQFIETLPKSAREVFNKQTTLVGKIELLISRAAGASGHQNGPGENPTTPSTSRAMSSRKRTFSSESSNCETTQVEDLPGYSCALRKRRRVGSFFVLSDNEKLGQKGTLEATNTESNTEETDEEIQNNHNRSNSKTNKSKEVVDEEGELSFELPSNRDISGAILKNDGFQQKLLELINDILQKAPASNITAGIENLLDDDSERTSLNLKALDDLIKNALEKAENDPTFNDVVQSIVTPTREKSESANKCQPTPVTTSTGVIIQSTPNDNLPPPTIGIGQTPAKTYGNTSFSSLSDSNFSISKLIVHNPSHQQVPQLNLVYDTDSFIQSLDGIGNVIFDASTEQLQFKLVTGGDGTFSMPEFITENTELAQPVHQELQQEGALCHPRREILVDEKIYFSIDQLPAGSVILNYPKENIYSIVEDANSIRFMDKDPQDVNLEPHGMDIERPDVECPGSIDKLINATSTNGTVPSSMESRILRERETPTTRIMNTKIFKSLSTPRKKSHVRVLDFSPFPNLYKREEQSIDPAAAVDGKENSNPSDHIPIVTHVEYLKNIPTIPEEVIEEPQKQFVLESESQSSSGFNVDQSNDTVINMSETPRRKTKSNSVKRVLSRRNSMYDAEEIESTVAQSIQTDETPNKSVKKNIEPNENTTPEIKPPAESNSLEEWHRLRSFNKSNFDQHLREMASKKVPPPTKRGAYKNRRKNTSADSTKTETPKKDVLTIRIETPSKDESFELAKHPPKMTVEFQQPPVPSSFETVSNEQEKCTLNMACLLDTPFKTDCITVPPTPCGFMPPNMETPVTKLLTSILQISSLKNADLPTPQFAITPSCGLTPLGKETPRSAHLSSHVTDYSSGGSYYKPDESDDLDKAIDKQLKAEMQKRKEILVESKNSIPPAKPTPVKIIPCESTVFTRVKSFTENPPQVEPHYKLSEPLPEEKDDHNESNASTSSSSSSSSSSSGSSSSSNSSQSEISMSVINSSEDEEWAKPKEIGLTANIAQLVTDDGEVRYPIRTWITPQKVEPENAITSIPAIYRPPPVVVQPTVVQPTVVRKIDPVARVDDERAKQMLELNEKRMRMKERLSSDYKANTNAPQPMLKRKIVRTSHIQKVTLGSKQVVIAPKSPQRRQSTHSMDLLTALNLSAKKLKQPSAVLPDKTEGSNPPPPDVDDNAICGVFEPEDVKNVSNERRIKVITPPPVNRGGRPRRAASVVPPDPAVPSTSTGRPTRKRPVKKSFPEEDFRTTTTTKSKPKVTRNKPIALKILDDVTAIESNPEISEIVEGDLPVKGAKEKTTRTKAAVSKPELVAKPKSKVVKAKSVAAVKHVDEIASEPLEVVKVDSPIKSKLKTAMAKSGHLANNEVKPEDKKESEDINIVDVKVVSVQPSKDGEAESVDQKVTQAKPGSSNIHKIPDEAEKIKTKSSKCQVVTKKSKVVDAKPAKLVGSEQTKAKATTKKAKIAAEIAESQKPEESKLYTSSDKKPLVGTRPAKKVVSVTLDMKVADSIKSVESKLTKGNHPPPKKTKQTLATLNTKEECTVQNAVKNVEAASTFLSKKIKHIPDALESKAATISPIKRLVSKPEQIFGSESTNCTNPVKNSTPSSSVEPPKVARMVQIPLEYISDIEKDVVKDFVLTNSSPKIINSNVIKPVVVDKQVLDNHVEKPLIEAQDLRKELSTDDEEEDAYLLCQKYSYNENDPETYRTIVYSGPDDYRPVTQRNPHLDTLVMNIFIDENEQRRLTVSKEIGLFVQAPKAAENTLSKSDRPIKVIPKKRKIPVNEHNIEEERVADMDTSTGSIASSIPSCTSTPTQPFKFKLSHRNRNDKANEGLHKKKIKIDKEKRPKKSKAVESNNVETTPSAGGSPQPSTSSIAKETNSKNIDIDAILSVVHGN